MSGEKGEYDEKAESYAFLGVNYYIVYNPEYWQRDRHQPFEVYKLVNDVYQLQIGEPFWMPEVGLGVGRCQTTSGSVRQEVLCWYNQQGNRYLTPSERAERLAVLMHQVLYAHTASSDSESHG